MHARDALGRLEVASSSAVMKAKKLPGCCAVSMTRVAAIDDDHRDRQRRRASPVSGLERALTRRQLVGGAFEVWRSPRTCRSRMKRLEREGLDDADALRGLLQRFQDGGEAIELVHHHLLDAAAIAEPADADDGQRHDQQRQRRTSADPAGTSQRRGRAWSACRAPSAVISRLSVPLADCEMKAWRAMNSVEWRAL